MGEQRAGLTMLQRWELDDKMYIEITQKRWILSILLGGIVGDALGVPFEFKQRDCGVTDMQEYGTYMQPKGTWSDDTSLTLCLMETLVEEGNTDDLMHKFVKYQQDGYLTPYGKMFDIGISTEQSISRFLSGIPASECGGKGENDNGNGSLMRISPLIAELLDEFDANKRHEEVKKWSEITHAHPRSILGCYIYMDILFYLACNAPLDHIFKYLNKDLEGVGLPYSLQFEHYQRILDQSIITASRDTIKSSGYIVDTLEAAIWCLFNTDNYKDAVLAAVNLGGDTDTIAFVTGTLAGMLYKIEAIPQEWINQLADKDNLMARIDTFIQHYVNKDLMSKYGTLDLYDFETSEKHQEMLRKNKTN